MVQAGLRVQLIFSITLFAVLGYFLYTGKSTAVNVASDLNSLSPSELKENKKAPLLYNYQIKSGDTFEKILKSLGTSPIEALELEKVWRGLGGPKLGIGANLKIRASDGTFAELHAELKDGDEIVISKNFETNTLYGMRTPADIVSATTTVSGTISATFVQAGLAAGLSYQTIDEFVDLFGNSVEFNREIHPGDTFTVTYEERHTSDGRLLPAGEIKRASLMNGGKLQVAIGRSDKNGRMHYFSQNGEMLGNYFLRYPLKFSRISSVFTGARFHPVLKRSKAHNGVDFAAPTGTPVRAIGDGVVTFAAYNGGAGNMLRISHGRFVTEYFHLSRFAPGVRKGNRVARGEIVGAVGTTGLSTGPHLHFGLFDNGRYVNPLTTRLPVMAPAGMKVSKEELQKELLLINEAHAKLAEAFSGKKSEVLAVF